MRLLSCSAAATVYRPLFTRHCGRHEVRCKRKYYGTTLLNLTSSFSHTFSVATSRRICARQYFDEAYPTLKEQRVFETNLFQKTQRANGKTTKNNAIVKMYSLLSILICRGWRCELDRGDRNRCGCIVHSLVVCSYRNVNIVNYLANDNHVCPFFFPPSLPTAEIIMFEGITCVYRSNVDLYFYVFGSSNENELILASVSCFLVPNKVSFCSFFLSPPREAWTLICQLLIQIIPF